MTDWTEWLKYSLLLSHFVPPEPRPPSFFSLTSAPLLWHMEDLLHLQDKHGLMKKVKAEKKWRHYRGGSHGEPADSLYGRRVKRDCREDGTAGTLGHKFDCTFCNKIHPLTWRAPWAKWPCWWAGQSRTPSGPTYCSPLVQSHRHDDAAQLTLQSPWHLESGPGRGAPESWIEHKTTTYIKKGNNGVNTKKAINA